MSSEDRSNDKLDALMNAVMGLRRAHQLASQMELEHAARVLSWVNVWLPKHGTDATIKMIEARRDSLLARLPPMEDDAVSGEAKEQKENPQPKRGVK